MDTVDEIYSRKVFIGGLPFDTTEENIRGKFEPYGGMEIDWPKRSGTASMSVQNKFPGYVFIIYLEEASVQKLIATCHNEKGNFYTLMKTRMVRQKPVQVRPWRLSDTDYIPRPSAPLNPRLTVFVGGLPRPTTASDLVFSMEAKYGQVIYAGIDVDPELKYPKGAARVTFSTHKSFMDAMAGRFITVPGANSKRAEIKPYIVEEQPCDQCSGAKCDGRYAPFFCPALSCMQYLCEPCWETIHSGKNEGHRPFLRLGDQ